MYFCYGRVREFVIDLRGSVGVEWGVFKFEFEVLKEIFFLSLIS